jgi:hypothetical protein
MDEYAPLFDAFWAHIVDCLRKGDAETLLWLRTGEHTGGFLWWCNVSDKEPDYWRPLYERVWQAGQRQRRGAKWRPTSRRPSSWHGRAASSG